VPFSTNLKKMFDEAAVEAKAKIRNDGMYCETPH
jgi:hypothetical protein